MDISTAKLLLPVHEDEYIVDVWEERLFSHKQFFLTRPPIREVWQARLNKMRKEYEAFILLTESCNVDWNELPQINTTITYINMDVVSVFNAYFKLRNEFKTKLISSFDPLEIYQIVIAWVNSEKKYYEVWSCEQALKDDIQQVIISKEPDPMDVLASIRDWKAKFDHATSFKDLCDGYTFLPELLKNEVKRLTSLYKRNS